MRIFLFFLLVFIVSFTDLKLHVNRNLLSIDDVLRGHGAISSFVTKNDHVPAL